jgi:hypothetical protein
MLIWKDFVSTTKVGLRSEVIWTVDTRLAAEWSLHWLMILIVRALTSTSAVSLRLPPKMPQPYTIEMSPAFNVKSSGSRIRSLQPAWIGTGKLKEA